MDYQTIAAQRAILERTVAGRTVDTLRLRGRDSLYIGFEGDIALKLACIPDMPYLHAVEKRYIPQRNAQDWHLAQFAGKRVTGVEIVTGDRVLTFTSESGCALVFEMTGRNVNIVVVSPDGTILGATRQVDESECAYRTMKPGAHYMPPPPRGFPAPDSLTPDDIVSALERAEGRLADVLAPLLGGSALCAREILGRCGLDPGAEAGGIAGRDIERIAGMCVEVTALILGGGDGGTVVMDPRDGLPKDVFPLRMVSPTGNAVYHESLDGAVEAYARDRELGLERRNLISTVVSALSREERSIRDTMKKIERDRGGETEPDDLDRKATAILASPGRVAKGTASAVVPDPYGGDDLTVALDPSLDGPANAAKLYARARKLRVAAKMSAERIETLSRRIDAIASERAAFALIEDIRELRTFAARYARKTGASREAEEFERFPRRFTSVSGLEIVVGRSDQENDELLHWARRTDIWLHAQGVAGSHVILRARGKETPDHRSIVQAAAIAAYFSKSKTSALVPVAWTLLKYVVKRKGQGPGQVTYTREKVLFVEPWSPKDGK